MCVTAFVCWSWGIKITQHVQNVIAKRPPTVAVASKIKCSAGVDCSTSNETVEITSNSNMSALNGPKPTRHGINIKSFKEAPHWKAFLTLTGLKQSCFIPYDHMAHMSKNPKLGKVLYNTCCAFSGQVLSRSRNE